MGTPPRLEALEEAFTPLWACICFATCWLPYRKRYYIVSRWNVFTIWLLKSICGIRYQVKGMENLPDEIVVDVTTLGLGKSIFVGDRPNANWRISRKEREKHELYEGRFPCMG